jgi:hypothetical protein
VIITANQIAGSARALTVHTQQSEICEAKSSHLVIIGGGKYNTVYREAVEKLGIPFHFFDTASESFHEIRNAERTTSYQPAHGADGAVSEDVGIVFRGRNPWAPDKYLVIVAGSHTYGSAAAVDFLLSPKHLRQVKGHMNGSFEVVVRATVRAHAIENVRQESPVYTV